MNERDHRWPLAIHEAGHAVIGHVAGVTIEEASITPGTDRGRATTGRCRYADGAPPLALATMASAGAIAQARVDPRHEIRAGATIDHQEAGRFIRQYLDGFGGTATVPEQVRVGSHINHRAAALVDQHWGAIERVASALLEEEALDCDELTRLITGDEIEHAYRSADIGDLRDAVWQRRLAASEVDRLNLDDLSSLRLHADAQSVSHAATPTNAILQHNRNLIAEQARKARA